MVDQRRIQQLIEELMDSGHTPEEACRNEPELLLAVREGWERLREVEAAVESLFPTPGRVAAGHRRRWTNLFGGPGGEFPSIPGYEIESVLGSGGMGVVYKAKHLKLKRSVAVKMVLSGAYATPQELTCLLREAQAVAGLRHEHIVHVHDVGELDGLPYFTMEFVEGGTLAGKLAGVPQTARKAAGLVVKLAGAVQAAHDGRIVHRDLKPSNILLTSDGSPKVADFSLARSYAGESSVTMGSARVGTPSYMAPEQALGKLDAFCPSVDIYALGAVLYETLTGRPPFHAETPAETQRQVIGEEPAPPSKLNARVPRDIETICLKCLQKDPQKRYATAAALSEDLQRFLRGEPITARPAGLPERAIKWVCRRPALATALAASALVVAILVGFGAWIAFEHGRTVQAVVGDLKEVELRQAAAHWPQAATALERAKARLAGGGSRDLRGRVARVEHDLKLVAQFDQIRLNRAAVVDGRVDRGVNHATADREYETAFRTAGLWTNGDESAAAVADRVNASAIRVALVAAIDDWTVCAPFSASDNRERLGKLFEIARLIDRDPAEWKERLRDPNAWSSKESLVELAGSAPEGKLPLSLLVALGERLYDKRADAAPFLRRVQREHPSDFWVNSLLGLALSNNEPDEAVRYFQAAVALRPDTSVAHANLGTTLGLCGHVDEALAELSEAVRLDPTLAFAHNGLGNILLLKGMRADATREYEEAIRLDPQAASALSNMGKVLAETGRLDEAAKYFTAALEVDPAFAAARCSLGYVLLLKGRPDEAIELCEHALRQEPDLVAGHTNLALALKAKGRLDEAIGCLEYAARIAPHEPDVRYNLGQALSEAGRSADAAAHYREVLRLNPRHAKAYHGLGIAVGEMGDLDEAVAHFRRALELDPDQTVSSGAIGRALLAQGRFAEAAPVLERYRDSLAKDDPLRAIMAGFIRECESGIRLESRLDAAIHGVGRPPTAQERLQFAEISRLKKRYADSARFFTDALSEDAALAGDARSSVRYNAASAAAMAASVATDVSHKSQESDGAEPARWRAQARRWLQADLALLEQQFDGDESSRRALKKALSRWQSDKALASIRDPDALTRLPAAEQEECRLLWKDVEAILARAAPTR